MATAHRLAANRFDLIRLALASAVFAYHAIVLSALSPMSGFERAWGHVAEIAIQGFFIVSGALVAGSLVRSQSLADYAGKRVRRLYPAYAAVIFIPALISLLMGGTVGGVAEYVGANLVFLNFLSPDLPGLFEGNRFSEVNGALWTLKIEVLFYLVLPLIGWMLRVMRGAQWIVLLGLYAVGEGWRQCVPVFLDRDFAPEIARQLPGQLAFFASGIALWQVWDRARARPLRFGVVGLLLTLLSFLHPWLEPLRAAGLAGIIASIAFLPGPALNAARFGDISYGVYITHFPILQGLVMAGAFAALGHAVGFALSVLFVAAASYALWHLVERPALRPSSHYRKVASNTEQD
jgi:peptidoglycan/LPS O-acetylase OafA/YrhL